MAEQVSVDSVQWPDFMRRFRWNQGEHIALIGPTGRGKTTLAGRILLRRKYVVAFDLKGNDSSLRRWGWEKILDWPPDDLEGRMKTHIEERGGVPHRIAPPPIRLILDPPKDDLEDIDTDIYADVLRDLYKMKGWTIYIDELLLACDRDHALGPLIHKILVSGRDRGVSVVTAMQTPNARDANVPKSTYQQASHLFIWPVRDFVGMERVEDITGVGRKIRETLAVMPKHDVLYVRPPDVIIATKSPMPEAPVQPRGAPELRVVPPKGDRPPARESRAKKLAWG